MENSTLIYSNNLDCCLKQTIQNTNDLLYNLQSIKQLQCNINNIQKIKNKLQIPINMTVLSYLRQYILEEENGAYLLRNLIRKYYPLNDSQILEFEDKYYYLNGIHSGYYITNMNVVRRKGISFQMQNKTYIAKGSIDLLKEITFTDINQYNIWEISTPSSEELYEYNPNIDFHKDDRILSRKALCTKYRNALSINEMISWDWNLVKDIKNGYCGSWDEKGIINLCHNYGFIAQMGVGRVNQTLDQLQEIGKFDEAIIEKTKIFYSDKEYLLYSYLPLSKEFITLHQDELDWTVLQRNPRINWDFELINMLLKKINSTICESDRTKHLEGTYSMYTAIKDFLNDEILNDIIKLYYR